jgi:hypothetical protein
MAIVEFTKDCYPYCVGDKLEMSEEEMKDVDALAAQREVSKPYKVVSDVKAEVPGETIKAVDAPNDVDRVNPVLSQEAAEANLQAPGVEAVAAKADEEEAKVDTKATKSSEKKSK